MGNAGNSNADAMELAQIEGPTSDSGEILFFMGPDDLQLRDMETIGDLDYWEQGCLTPMEIHHSVAVKDLPILIQLT